MSYAELDAAADRVAAGLRRLGLTRGDRVVVQLPNVVEFPAVCFGLLRLGALPVFALPPHREHEISYLAEHSEAVAYLACDTVRRLPLRRARRGRPQGLAVAAPRPAPRRARRRAQWCRRPPPPPRRPGRRRRGPGVGRRRPARPVRRRPLPPVGRHDRAPQADPQDPRRLRLQRGRLGRGERARAGRPSTWWRCPRPTTSRSAARA